MIDPFLKNHYYHIYNRGCNKENIFFNPENYIYLLRKIQNTRHKYGATLLAYCLMPNHYHFLARQESERPLSDWIQTLFNGYTQAINKQQGRSGTLFQGRAKHILVDNDAYLIHLARYIHYNPVEARLVHLPEKWAYSNYAEWIGQRKGTLMDVEFIKSYFPQPDDYRRFVMDYSIKSKLAEKLEKYLFDS
jgi:REP element-mobilizing transposase RayT